MREEGICGCSFLHGYMQLKTKLMEYNRAAKSKIKRGVTMGI